MRQYPERDEGLYERPDGPAVSPGWPQDREAPLNEGEFVKVLTVCQAGPPACDYGSIQTAVDAAHDGDVIKVASGTYTDLHGRPVPPGYPSPPASGIITQVVYVSKSVTLRGGYTVAFTGLPDPKDNCTTLDAQGRGRTLFIAGDISPTIEGLRLTHGDAAGLGGRPLGKDAGGGVYVLTATAVLRNNHVFSNTADIVNGYGGGLYLCASAAKLSRNIVSCNTVATGGGLCLYHSGNAMLFDNMIFSNTAQWDGGGVYLDHSDGTMLSGNTVSRNSAGAGGGGLALYYSAATVGGDTVSGNTACWGGGLDLNSSAATVSGNAILGNAAKGLPYCGDGGGIHLSHSDNATLSGNVILGNVASSSIRYGGGGGSYLYSSAATLSGNLVAANTAGHGGGLYLDGSDGTLTNNIVVDNLAHGTGSGLYIRSSIPRLLHTTIARNGGGDGSGAFVADGENLYSAVALTNTILVSHAVGIKVGAGNTATLEATLWGAGTWANDTDLGGGGMITIGAVNLWDDPDFVDAEKGDYHIGPDSAALDAGADAGVRKDVDHEPRPYRDHDLGADEYWPPGTPHYFYLPLVFRESP